MTESNYVDACEYEYLSASGGSIEDCLLLGYRTPYGHAFSPSELEAWVIHFTPESHMAGSLRVTYMFGTSGWLTGLWWSPSGTAYVSEIDGTMHVCRDVKNSEPDAWEEVTLDAQLSGVWGLSEECVFTWGQRNEKNRMYRHDGRKWYSMPSPGDVSVLRGLSPDFLYAVGYGGMMARWDGHAWIPVQIPVKSNFTGLFVAGPDELYATTESGELWEGTSHGWAKRAQSAEGGPLLDVAKFKGEVWVAGGEEGLLRLKGGTNELECVKPNIEAKSFDVRGNLLITTKDFIAQTVDGVKFQARGRDAFEKSRASIPPLWLE